MHVPEAFLTTAIRDDLCGFLKDVFGAWSFVELLDVAFDLIDLVDFLYRFQRPSGMPVFWKRSAMVSNSDIGQHPLDDLVIDTMRWVVVSCIFIEETEPTADN